MNDVMFGRNRRILRSIVSGRVALLSGASFCIAGNVNWLRDIEKSYTVASGSSSRKVTPAMGRFRSKFRPLFF